MICVHCTVLSHNYYFFWFKLVKRFVIKRKNKIFFWYKYSFLPYLNNLWVPNATCSVNPVIYMYNIFLSEARDRSIKAIAFAKLLRKDLEVAAEYKLTADPRKLLNMLHMTGHVQVSMSICWPQICADLVSISIFWQKICESYSFYFMWMTTRYHILYNT